MCLFEKGDYMFSFDLKSGYHHVDIAKEHWKYLGFSCQSYFYVFTVLPFGFSSEFYIFAKLLRPLVPCEILALTGSQNHYTLYLDDGLCAREGKRKALEASVLVCSTLGQAGFLVNAKKSIWKLTQQSTVAEICYRPVQRTY